MIINGDSIQEMRKLDPESVDLIFADPPYWMRVEGTLTRVEGTEFSGCNDEWDQFENLNSYEQFTRDWLEACHRVLKPNGSLWVIGGMQCIYSIGSTMHQIGYWLINDVVWQKTNPTPNFMGTRLNNSHETLIWATKSKKSKFTFNYKTAKELNKDTVSDSDFLNGTRKQMGSVWRFSVCSGNERLKDDDGKKLHSTQKPLELLERIIAISSNIGDVVLDPFAGTMTTGVAAKKMGRNYIMLEKDAKYCLHGAKRLENTFFQDTEIARAGFDIKPKKVSLPEMISESFLIENEEFFLKNGTSGGYLRRDGKLQVGGEAVNIHTAAALAKGSKALRLNGFDHWFVIRDDGLVPISKIREDYRSTLD